MAWADSGWVNMVTARITVPISSTELANPAEACKRNGPTVFFQGKIAWNRRMWLT